MTGRRVRPATPQVRKKRDGVEGGIRTHGITDLQSVALSHLATPTSHFFIRQILLHFPLSCQLIFYWPRNIDTKESTTRYLIKSKTNKIIKTK